MSTFPGLSGSTRLSLGASLDSVEETSQPTPQDPASRAQRAGLDAAKPDHALWIALLDENEEGVLAALAAGADPNSGAPEVATASERQARLQWQWQNQGETPIEGNGWALGYAASTLQVRSVQALLAAGADPFRGRLAFAEASVHVVRPSPAAAPQAQSSTLTPSSSSAQAQRAQPNGPQASVSQVTVPAQDPQELHSDALTCALLSRHAKGPLEEEADKIDAIANALWENMQERVLRGEASQQQLYRWRDEQEALAAFLEASWGGALWMARHGLFGPESALRATHGTLALAADRKVDLIGMHDWNKIALLSAFMSGQEFLDHSMPPRKNTYQDVSDQNEYDTLRKEIRALALLDIHAQQPWASWSTRASIPVRRQRALFALSASGPAGLLTQLLGPLSTPVTEEPARVQSNREEAGQECDPDAVSEAVIRLAQFEHLRDQMIDTLLASFWVLRAPVGHASLEQAQPPLHKTLDWLNTNGAVGRYFDKRRRLKEGPSCSQRWQTDFWKQLFAAPVSSRQSWLVEQGIERVESGRWKAAFFFSALCAQLQRTQLQVLLKTKNNPTRASLLDQVLPTSRATNMRALELLHRVEAHHAAFRVEIHRGLRQLIELDNWTSVRLLGAPFFVHYLSHETPEACRLSKEDSPPTTPDTLDRIVGFVFHFALLNKAYQCAQLFLEELPELSRALLAHPQWIEQDLLALTTPEIQQTGAAGRLQKAAADTCSQRLEVLRERVALGLALAPSPRDAAPAGSESGSGSGLGALSGATPTRGSRSRL